MSSSQQAAAHRQQILNEGSPAVANAETPFFSVLLHLIKDVLTPEDKKKDKIQQTIESLSQAAGDNDEKKWNKLTDQLENLAPGVLEVARLEYNHRRDLAALREAAGDATRRAEDDEAARGQAATAAAASDVLAQHDARKAFHEAGLETVQLQDEAFLAWVSGTFPLLKDLVESQSNDVDHILCPWLRPAREILPSLQKLLSLRKKRERDLKRRCHFDELSKLTPEQLANEDITVQLWYAEEEVKQLTSARSKKIGDILKTRNPFIPHVREPKQQAAYEESQLRYPNELDNFISTKTPFKTLEIPVQLPSIDGRQQEEYTISSLDELSACMAKLDTVAVEPRKTDLAALEQQNSMLDLHANYLVEIMRRLRDNNTQYARVCAKIQNAQYLPAKVRLFTRIIEFDRRDFLDSELILHVCECRDRTGYDAREIIHTRLSAIGSTKVIKHGRTVTGKRVLNKLIRLDNDFAQGLKVGLDARQERREAEIKEQAHQWELKWAGPSSGRPCTTCGNECSLQSGDDGKSPCVECVTQDRACKILCKVCQTTYEIAGELRKDCVICDIRYSDNIGTWPDFESIIYNLDASSVNDFYQTKLEHMVVSYSNEEDQNVKTAKRTHIYRLCNDLLATERKAECMAANLLDHKMREAGSDPPLGDEDDEDGFNEGNEDDFDEDDEDDFDEGDEDVMDIDE